MNYEQQIREALARGYCTPENSSKILDSVLIEAMTQEVLKSVDFIPNNESRPIEQQVSREVGGQCRAEKNIVKDIATIINQHSRENVSNTPDFILAEYLERCLIAFEMASNAREKWYEKKLSISGSDSRPIEQQVNVIYDKNGVEIKDGDIIYNSWDRNPYQQVRIIDGKFMFGKQGTTPEQEEGGWCEMINERYRFDLYWEKVNSQ